MVALQDENDHGENRGRCGAGVVELFVPPHPPKYTPMAITIPPTTAAPQLGVTLVWEAATNRNRRQGEKYVFALHTDDNSFRKGVSLTHRQFDKLLHELKAMFPTVLESYHVVDVKKILFVTMRKTVTRSAQDILHTLRQLVMIPEVLESNAFHQTLGFSSNDTLELNRLAQAIRTSQHASAQIRAVLDDELARLERCAAQDDVDYAQHVYAPYVMVARHRCFEPVRQPLLVYDHDMVMKIAPLTFGKTRTRIVTGPGDHVYFTFRRQQHKTWTLVDTLDNELAQLSYGHEGAAGDNNMQTRHFLIKRAFPVCRFHQQQNNSNSHDNTDSDRHTQMLPALTAVGYKSTNQLEFQAVSSSSGTFVGLRNVCAMQQRRAIEMDNNIHCSHILSYRVTAETEDSFTVFLGVYQYQRKGGRVMMTVHTGQDLVTMLMVALAIDCFALS